MKRVITLRSKVGLLMLLIIPMFEPRYINYTRLHILFKTWLIMSVVIILFLSVLYYEQIDLKSWMLQLIIFLWAEMTTLFHGGSLAYCFKRLGIPLALVMLFQLCVSSGYLDELFSAFNYYFFIVVTINLISVIASPNGINGMRESGFPLFFLSADNFFIVVLLYATVISIISYMNNSSKIRMIYLVYLLVANSFVFIYRWTVTSMVVWFLFLFINALGNKKSSHHLFNPLTYIIGFVVCVMFTIGGMYNGVINGLLEHYLKRNMTFSSRNMIWVAELKYIMTSPIFGHGYLAEGYQGFSYDIYGISLGSHSYYLRIWATTGLIGLILLGIYISLSFIKLYIYRDSVISNIISSSIVCYLVMMLMENYSNEGGFYVLVNMGCIFPLVIKTRDNMYITDNSAEPVTAVRV